MELKGSPPKPLNTTFDNNSHNSIGKSLLLRVACHCLDSELSENDSKILLVNLIVIGKSPSE